MTRTEQTAAPRLMTPAELAAVVRMLREVRQWSQEQLARVSGISSRTVQRVENGKPSDFDTRRAIAQAFEFDDIDALNKPYAIPTAEELEAHRAQFERDHVTLDALPLTTGRQLAELAEAHTMDLSTPGFEMPREADEEFAALVDYFRDYRDCADVYSQLQKFEVYDALQAHIDALAKHGVSLRYAVRELAYMLGDPPTRPWRATALYVVAFRSGEEPPRFATPRKVGIGCG